APRTTLQCGNDRSGVLGESFGQGKVKEDGRVDGPVFEVADGRIDEGCLAVGGHARAQRRCEDGTFVDVTKDVVPRPDAPLDHVEELDAADVAVVHAEIPVAHGRRVGHQHVRVLGYPVPDAEQRLAARHVERPRHHGSPQSSNKDRLPGRPVHLDAVDDGLAVFQVCAVGEEPLGTLRHVLWGGVGKVPHHKALPVAGGGRVKGQFMVAGYHQLVSMWELR
ncbi:unnamed protein product, partial [Ixodes pacificus]